MAHVVRTLGRFLVLGAGAGVIAAAVGSFVWGPSIGLVAAGVCLLLAAGGALALEALRRRSPLAGATRVDEALGLKDRISSALEFGDGADPFVRLAVADAERVAADADVRRAVPVRTDRSWAVWPVLGAAAVAAALIMPMVPRGGREVVDPAQVARTRESLALAAADLEADLDGAAEPEAAQQDAIDRMREIERELAAGVRTPEDAATEASAVVEEAAARLETQAQAERERALRERLDQIEPEEVGAAAALAEALREGDLDGAAKALLEMSIRGEQATDAERRQIAEDLRKLAEQLRPDAGMEAAADGSGEPGAADEPAPDATGGGAPGPDDQPAPEATTEPGEVPATEPQPDSEQPSPPDDAPTRQEEAAEPSGSDEAEQSPKTGDDQAAREQVEQGAREEAQRRAGESDAEDLAERLDDMAKRIENPDRPRQGGAADRTEPRQSSDGAEPEPSDRGEPQPGAADEQRPPEENAPDGANRGDEQGGERQAEPSLDQPGKTGSSEGSKPSDESAEGERDQATDPPGGSRPAPGAEGQGSENSNPASQQGTKPGDESGSDAPGRGDGAGGESANPVEGEPKPGTTPNAAQEGAGDSDGQAATPSGRASDDPNNVGAPSQPMDTVAGGEKSGERDGGGDELDRAIDQIEQMDRRQRESLQRLGQSQKLRDRARELLEGASPEQQRRIADLADRLREEMGPTAPPEDWNPETELFDARAADRPEGTNRQVGTAEPTGPPERGGQGSTVSRSTQVREAAAAAEQAIEGQAIPRKYREYVRKVYRRLEEQAAAVEEGKDADAPAGDKPGAGG